MQLQLGRVEKCGKQDRLDYNRDIKNKDTSQVRDISAPGWIGLRLRLCCRFGAELSNKCLNILSQQILINKSTNFKQVCQTDNSLSTIVD